MESLELGQLLDEERKVSRAPKWEHVDEVVFKLRTEARAGKACLNISYIDYDVRDGENYDTDAAISFSGVGRLVQVACWKHTMEYFGEIKAYPRRGNYQK